MRSSWKRPWPLWISGVQPLINVVVQVTGQSSTASSGSLTKGFASMRRAQVARREIAEGVSMLERLGEQTLADQR